MAEIKLKPCPFCGGEAKIAITLHMGMRAYRFFAICLACNVEMPRTSKTMTQAAKAWNTRAEEIVHCKDCKYLEITGCYGECGKAILGIVSPDDFCSLGERRECYSGSEE